MSKRPFVIFGVLLAVLAVVIPLLVFAGNGESSSGGRSIPSNLDKGKELFDINCGTCHALYVAGTDGNFGPNLDLLLAPTGPPADENAKSTIASNKARVKSAVINGVNTETTPGRMPAGILAGEQGNQVAEFVANVPGRG